jgi:hypothetical protein
MRRHAFVDGGFDGPPAFAAIPIPGPRSPTAPDPRSARLPKGRATRRRSRCRGARLRDVGQVQIVLIMFGIAQRACRPGWTVPGPKSDCAPAKLSTNSWVWSSRVGWATAIDISGNRNSSGGSGGGASQDIGLAVERRDKPIDSLRFEDGGEFRAAGRHFADCTIQINVRDEPALPFWRIT